MSISLTHLCLRVPSEIVVWIYDTFDNNLRTQNYFKGGELLVVFTVVTNISHSIIFQTFLAAWGVHQNS